MLDRVGAVWVGGVGAGILARGGWSLGIVWVGGGNFNATTGMEVI